MSAGHLTLSARYQPEARTLEFDLTDAPLVDAVTDVVVAACGAVPPLWGTTTAQRALFYGCNTFLLHRPLVFDHDSAALLCCLRLREWRLTDLADLAGTILSGGTASTSDEETSRGATGSGEYVVLLTESPSTAAHTTESDDYVYFTARIPSPPPPPLPPHVTGAVTPPHSAVGPAPLCTHAAPPSHRPPSPSSPLLPLSAVALCYL
ncbi:hypothetical protein NESM_000734000 [Novymonas esmeraldas]|uniref:Uncharacterized protein n=1 Tax=Novymonas esmeraldas TaxID=1808958 RepID=A0AAW0EWL6_9TRYP